MEEARLQEEVWWSGKVANWPVGVGGTFPCIGVSLEILLLIMSFVSQVVTKASCFVKYLCKISTLTHLCISLDFPVLSVLSESKQVTR